MDIDEPTAPFGVLEGVPSGSANAVLEPDLARRVRVQGRRLRVGAATLFHAAWGLVVAHTSGRQDIVFGTVLGSTFPLRLRLKEISTLEYIQQIERELGVAQCGTVIEDSRPLFSAILNYRHLGCGAIAASGGHPICLSVDDRGEDFGLEMETDRRIDPNRMIGYTVTALESLLQALEGSAAATDVLSLSILPDAERRQLLESFNATQTPYPRDILLQQLLERQVERTPTAPAVRFEGTELTYAQLNSRSNQLAHYLRSKGVGPDRLVGLCLERSIEMVVGLVGIAKAGGAYVPFDPTSPPGRLAYMLEDCAPAVILTLEKTRSRLPPTAAEVIVLDRDSDTIAQYPSGNLSAAGFGLRSHHLAYVIYTSGSTGNPKGAMNEHRGVVNRLQWMQDAYQLGPDDRVLQKTPFSFDVSVWEFFWTLMTGATLVVARPEGHKDPQYLRELIEEQAITTLHFVPSMLQSFLAALEPGQCAGLRHIVCSGEELPAALQKRCFELLPEVKLSNLYGPTEAAVDVTVWECSPGDSNQRVPIGRPISNLRLYVLDTNRNPAPLGVPGEIYIAGIGVGRGYLNRPELTRERFVPDPFAPMPVDAEPRMYKTGDLGRWRPDGSLEYLGRNDHQVKIRGFRIELGEIEAQLSRYPGVKSAVVTARKDSSGEQRLAAYVVAGSEVEPGGEAARLLELRAHLKQTLPDYMIPTLWAVLGQMPLTHNGKVDRAALPEPKGLPSDAYVVPRTQNERVLVDIWKQVLDVEHVGIRDSFLDLGGYSLKAMKVVAKVAQRLAFELSVVDVLQFPTVEKLAEVIASRADAVEYEGGVI